jgi:hypothetical protein
LPMPAQQRLMLRLLHTHVRARVHTQREIQMLRTIAPERAR